MLVIVFPFIVLLHFLLRCRRQLIPRLPLDRIFIASDSPFYTPQNIDDVWIREQRNEPSNLPALLQVLSELLRLSKQDVTAKQLATRSRGAGVRDALQALNILYVLVATGAAKRDDRHQDQRLHFNISRR